MAGGATHRPAHQDDHIYLGGRGHDILRFWLGDKEAERA